MLDKPAGRRTFEMPFHVATVAASYREATEDRLAVHQLDGGFVVVVAGGVGGISGGGRAADLAMKILRQAIEHGAFNLERCTRRRSQSAPRASRRRW